MASGSKYEIEIDISVKAALDNMQKLNKMAVDLNNAYKKAGETFKKTFSDKPKSNAPEKELVGIIEKLEQSYRNLEQAKRKATSTDDIAKYNKELEKTRKELDSVGNTGKNIQQVNNNASAGIGIFKQLGGAIVAAFSVQAVIQFAKMSYDAYQQQLKFERLLLNALEGRRDVQQRLIAQSNSIKQRTGIDEGDIIQLQTYLAAQNLTEKQIKKTTEAAIQLAAVTGQDLQSVTMILGGTYEGVVGRLGRLDNRFKTLTQTQLENGAAIDLILKKYKGFAEASATDSQRVAVSFEDITKQFGKLLTTISQPGLQLLNSDLKNTNLLITYLEDGLEGVAKELGIVLKTTPTLLEQSNQKLQDIIDRSKELLASGKSKTEISALNTAYKEFIITQAGFINKANEAALASGAIITPFVATNAKMAKDAIDILTVSFNAYIKALQDGIKIEPRTFKTLEEEIAKLNTQLETAILNGNKQQEKALSKLISTKTKTLKEYKDAFDELTKISEKPTFGTLNNEISKLKTQLEQAILEEKDARFMIDLAKRIEEKTEILKKRQDFYDALLKFYQPKEIEKISGTLRKSFTDVKEDIDKYTQSFEEGNSFWQKLLGFGSESGDTQSVLDKKKADFEKLVSGFKEIGNKIIDNINQIAQAEVDAADRQVNTLNRLYEEKQRAISNEIQLNKDGAASSVKIEQARLNEIERQRNIALERQKKALATQKALETASQTLSLLSATANIIKEWSSLSPFGIIGALASIATMFAAFAKARVDATNATKFAEGGVLQGRSHANGGIYIHELNSEVEGGEYVTNKKSTQKYLPLLNAINKDNKELLSIELNKNLVNDIDRKQAIINKIEVNTQSDKYLKSIERLMKDANEQPTVIHGRGYRIEKSKGLIRKIYEN